jgi:hypothetical protein
MSKEPERELRVMVHPPKKLVELILLADGLPLGSVQFTQEQAENHAREFAAATLDLPVRADWTH